MRLSLPRIKFGQVIERIKGSKSNKIKKLEEKDFSLFQSMSLLAEGLNKPPLAYHHPIRSFSQSLKGHLLKYQSSTTIELIDLIIKLASLESQKQCSIYSDMKLQNENLEADTLTHFQYALRIDYLNYYFISLKKALEAGQVSPSRFQFSNLLVLMDATLLGTGAERVSAHLHLYRPVFNQAELQNSFYLLYNSEIEAIVNGFRKFPGLQKHQMKHFPSAARVYLLDTLELNSKSRCVFAWADKNYSTFQDLTDDQEIGVDKILASRLLYFEEGNSIGKQFIESYIADRRMKINDREETRQNIRLGSLFFVLTCLIDWYLCTI